MPKLFKVDRAIPIPATAEIVAKKGTPHVRILERGKPTLYPLAKDGQKYLKPSSKWCAEVSPCRWHPPQGLFLDPPRCFGNDARRTVEEHRVAESRRPSIDSPRNANGPLPNTSRIGKHLSKRTDELTIISLSN